MDAGDAFAADAGPPDAGASADAGPPSDAGADPCLTCPAGAFCSRAGVCDFACGSCQRDEECGPAHRCWKGECIAHQPPCLDDVPIAGVRLELDWCTWLGVGPFCQRVLELPFDGGLATVTQEPIAPFDGGVTTRRMVAPPALVSGFVDAGLTCVDQPRLEQFAPACLTHSGQVRVTVRTSAGDRRSAWTLSSALRPPRAVEAATFDAIRFVNAELADAGAP